MSNVPCTNVWSHLLPVKFYASFKISHILGLVFVPEIGFHASPNFLDWIEIRAFSRALPPSDIMLLKKVLDRVESKVNADREIRHAMDEVCRKIRAKQPLQ